MYYCIICKIKCVCACRTYSVGTGYIRLAVYVICPNVTTHERVILFRRPGQPWLFLPEIKCVVSGVKNTNIHCMYSQFKRFFFSIIIYIFDSFSFFF